MSDLIWLDIDEHNSVGVKIGTPWCDDEIRSPIECYGFHVFAWMPRRCRNGKVRWLCFVERHGDGTYTKSR
jgi:hypothetical protein